MKSATAGMITHINGATLTLATLYRVTWVTGTQFYFTDHNRPIVIDVEAPAAPVSPQTYVADPSGYTRTNIRTTGSMSVDSVDVESAIDRAGGLDERDVRAGLWDYAEVEMWTVNYLNVADGVIDERKGRFGQVSLQDEITNN